MLKNAKEMNALIKIKVSYEHPKELQHLIDVLGQKMKRIKAPKQQAGKFKKVYIELKEDAEK